MLGLVYEDGVRLRRDLDSPSRKPGEARIRVSTAGICDTDLQIVRGYMGFSGVLGHEFVGTVIDADDPGWCGRRVVGDINAGCGDCLDCQDEGGHHCPSRTVLGIVGRDGAFAEELVLPERCLVEVPETLDNDRAVFAEPLAAALHIMDEIGRDRQSAIVVGDGKLGLLIALALNAAGIETTIVGHHPHKLALAMGCTRLVESDLPADLKAPIIVEATGSENGLTRALSLCSPRGTVFLKSTIADAHSADLSPIVINELRVVGSRCGRIDDAIRILSRGEVDPRPLISARFSLDDAPQAMQAAELRGTLKVLIDIDKPTS